MRETAKNISERRSQLTDAKRALLEKRLRAVRAGSAQPPTIPRCSNSGPAPLSFSQQRLWFLDQLEPGTSVYNLPSTIRLTGPLSATALEQSLNEIVRRHDVLRTTFAVVNGQPVQIISPPEPFALPLVDLGHVPDDERQMEVRRLAGQAAKRSFDLARGPLWQVILLRLAEEQHVLLLTMHHIISDGWSMSVFFRELSRLYQAISHGQPCRLPELSIQYADYAVWQQQWLQGDGLENHLAYWRQQLAGVPVLELPTDRPRPPMQTFRGARQPLVLSPALSQRLQALSRQEGVTLFMLLLAAFQTLLCRYTGQEDISVGTFVANRDRAETRGLIGFFVNNLVFRTDLSGNPRFRELLGRVREVTLGAYAHQEIPFEKLLEELQPRRDLSRTPLFQVLISLRNYPRQAPELPDLAVRRSLTVDGGRSNFDLTLSLSERAGRLTGSLQYNADLFEAATITRMLGHFQTLLEGIVADPEQRLWDLPLLTETERQQLLNWSVVRGPWSVAKTQDPGQRTTDNGQRTTLPHLFEAQVERTPEAVAVVCEDEQLTYQELNRRANQLAHYLQSLGVGPEVRVGLCLDRSLDMVIGLLGILKAGGAYVPLDPMYPQERLAFMLEDSQAAVLVTQTPLLDQLPEHQAQVVCLDQWAIRHSPFAIHNPDSGVVAENLAYVIYTSGTTGRPKGVMVTHGALVNFTQAAQEAYRLEMGDRVLQFASISFDASAEEIYPGLSRGATLVLRSDRLLESFSLFLRACEAWGVTVLDLPTAYWHELAAHLAADGLMLPACVRLVIVGGERALGERLALWQQQVGAQVRLVNTYGPTEATVVATVGELVAGARQWAVPIGRPIGKVQVYVLDRFLAPTPIGVPGELHLGGAGVARGYLNRPELTAEKFIPNPFVKTQGPRPKTQDLGQGESLWSSEGGERLYRTGDVGRYRPDGQLEFVGRVDQQVKVRGYRIEVGEVEAVLSQHPAVREVVVAAREDEPGDRQLVAYLVATPGPAPAISEWRRYVRERLPEYMLPSAWVLLEELPRLPSGKVDRRALPAPDGSRPGLEKSYVAPRTELERFLAGLWQDLLKIEQVGIQDNFFELGGNSLQGAVMVNRLQAALAAYVYVVAIFEAPTIAALAGYLVKHYRAAVVKAFGVESVDGRGDEGGAPAGRVDAAKLAQMRRLIRPLPPRPVSEGAGPNPPAIFILTPPRSGSTLLRVMLAGHPRLFAPPEMHLLSFNTLGQRRAVRLQGGQIGFWEGTIRALMEINGCDVEQATRIMEACEDQNLTTQQFYRRMQEWIGDRLLVDKSIYYALNGDILRRAEADFQEAKYIHLVRHPCGMIRSFEEARLDRVMFRDRHGFSVRELAELIWVVCQENILAFLKEVPARRQHRVGFEALVAEPRRVMEGVCEFLGLAFEAEMLEPYKEKQRRMTDGIHQESRMIGDVKFHEHRGIEAKVADQWKQAYREDFLGDITWQIAESLGYERAFSETAGALAPAEAFTPIVSISRGEARLLAQLPELSDEEVRSLLDEILVKEEVNT